MPFNKWFTHSTLFVVLCAMLGSVNQCQSITIGVHQGARASGVGKQHEKYRLAARHSATTLNLSDWGFSGSSNNFNNSLLSEAKLPLSADALLHHHHHRRRQNRNYKTFTAETRRAVRKDVVGKRLPNTTHQSNFTVTQQDAQKVVNNSFLPSAIPELINENDTSVLENLTEISVPQLPDKFSSSNESGMGKEAPELSAVNDTTAELFDASTESTYDTTQDFPSSMFNETNITEATSVPDLYGDTPLKNLTTTVVSNYQVINSLGDASKDEEIAVVTMTTLEKVAFDNVSAKIPSHSDNRSKIAQTKAPWNIAWEVHVYLLGALFIVVMTMCLVIAIYNCLQRPSTNNGTYLITNGLVFMVASTRSFLLLYDAYNVNGNFPPLVAKLLFDLTFPSLVSGFTLNFVELVQSINFKCKCAKYLRTSRVSAAVIVHYTIVIVLDVTVVHVNKYNDLIYFLTQTVCTIWTIILITVYFSIYQQLFLAALRKQGEIIRLTFTKLHIEGAPLPSNLPKPYLSLAVRLLLCTAILSVLLTCFHLFGTVLVCDFLPGGHLTFWPWWTYHSCSRLIELSLCFLLIIITCLHDNYEKLNCNRRYRVSDLCHRLFRRCSCRRRIVITNDDIYPTYHVSNAAVARTNFTFERWDASLPVTLCNPDASTPSPTPLSNQNVIKHFLPIEGTTNGSSLSSRYLPSATLLSSASDCYRSLGSRRQVVRATMTTLSDIHNRPPSMLFNENGFIRFRDPEDPEQPMAMMDEEGIQNMDKINSIINDDRIIISDSMRRAIRGSHETDVSSADQWSTCNNHSGIGTLRRHGSTCSSESATTSFDVHLFLHPTPLSGTKTMKLCNRRSANTTPNKEKCNLVMGNRISCGTTTVTRPAAPPHLNLTPNARVLPIAPGGQNIQDITPDSAVFLELPTPTDDNNPEPGCSSVLISNFSRAQQQCEMAFSQSLNDLHGEAPTPNKLTPRHKGRSRSLLSRLKGSTFSLTSHHGYEPLSSNVHSQTTLGRMNKLWRTNSEDSSVLQPAKDYRQWEMRTVFRDSGASSRMSRERQRDSFYDSDLSSTTGSKDLVHYVDTEVQTDPVDFTQVDKSDHAHDKLKTPIEVPILEPLKKEQESVL